MKRKVMTAIITILCCTFSIMPFSVVKAANTVYQQEHTFTQGQLTFTAYEYPNGYTQVHTDILGYNYYDTVVDLVFTLNDIYTGTIRVNFNSSFEPWDYLYFPVGNGISSYDTPSNQHYIDINVIGCQSFELILAQYQGSGYVSPRLASSDIVVANLSTESVNLADYQIPMEMIPAYVFTTGSFTSTPLVYSDGDLYPHISITSVPQNGRIVNLPAYTDVNNDVHYIFMTSADLNSGDITLSSTTNTTLTINQIVPYTFSSMKMYDLIIRYSGRNAANRRIVWNVAIDVYPFFYGYEKNMTENMKALCGFTTDQQRANVILDVIQYDVARIYALLNQNQQDSTVNDDLEDAADDISDITDQEHDIISGYQSDLTDFNTSVDLNDYNFITGLGNASEYFKTKIDLVFTQSANAKAFWIIPVILVVLTVLLGR